MKLGRLLSSSCLIGPVVVLAACGSSSPGDLFPASGAIDGADAAVDSGATGAGDPGKTGQGDPGGGKDASTTPQTCGSPEDPATGCGAGHCVPCSIPYGSPKCTAGACAILACNPGRADCNGDPRDGCEVDITSDHGHCGGCTTACAGSQVCGPSGCAATCPGILTSCNGSCVDTSSSPQNCGGCGTSCPGTTNGVPICVAKSCGVQCNQGYVPCVTGCCAQPPPPPPDAGTDSGGGGGGGGNDAGGNDSGGGSGSCAATTSCESNVSLGTVRGDSSADVVRMTGTTSEWLQVNVSEGDSSFALHDFKFSAFLTSPPGMDFELYAYVSPCGSGLYGQGPTVTGGWADTFGIDDSKIVLFEVRYVSGGACGQSWSLQVNGNQ